MEGTPAYASELRSTVLEATKILLSISDEQAARRPAPDKWSAKEIIGHLIDSANNNHRRFVIAPAKDDLVFEGYQQEFWVETQQYQKADWQELVILWQAYNLHISFVMRTIPAAVREKEHSQHSLQRMAWKTIPSEESTTLDYLMADYVGHLKHHLQQIDAIIDSSEA